MGARLVDRDLRPVATAGPYVDLEPLCSMLIRRMRSMRHTLRGGVYLIADRQGRIYLLAEAASTAPAVLKRRERDLVGMYTHPTVELLRADLARHLCNNGVVSEQAIYEAVRQVEG